jgi:hypothetical protein
MSFQVFKKERIHEIFVNTKPRVVNKKLSSVFFVHFAQFKFII